MSNEPEQDYEVWTVSYGSTRCIAKVRTCGTCGEYRGEMHNTETGEIVALACVCDGPVCPKCGLHKKHPRGSLNMKKNGEIWHTLGYPYFPTCSGCWNKGQAESRARTAQASGTWAESQSTSAPAPEQDAGGRDWLKFVDECFPPGARPKGPFGEG